MTPPLRPLPELPDGVRGTAQAMAMVLASQVGYREGADNDQVFGAWYGFPRVAWCAQFQSWGANAAGVAPTIIPKHQYTPSGADWFRKRGQLHDEPQPGDLGYVYFKSAGRIGHVFFVERLERRGDGSTVVHTIEGNTNDTGSPQGIGVFRLNRTLNANLSFGRPAYAPSSESEFSVETKEKIDALFDHLLKVNDQGKIVGVGPGQATVGGTIAAALDNIQGARSTLSEIDDHLTPFTIVGADDGSRERYLVVAGGLDHLDPDEYNDLLGRGAAREFLLKPKTIATLRKPQLVP